MYLQRKYNLYLQNKDAKPTRNRIQRVHQYDSEGNYLYTKKVTGTDSVFISEYVKNDYQLLRKFLSEYSIETVDSMQFIHNHIYLPLSAVSITPIIFMAFTGFRIYPAGLKLNNC